MTVHGVWKPMRWASLVAVTLALVAGAAAPRVQATTAERARTAKPAFPPVLGISFGKERGTLAWFDPLTLKPLHGRKAPLAGWDGSWAFSSDRSELAVGSCNPPEIRFVDARAMRVLGDLRLWPYAGCAGSFAWLRPDRLLAVISLAGELEVAVVDPSARRVLRRQALPFGVWHGSGRTRDELVFLLGGDGSIAPARLAVVDADGALRVVGVDRILAGTVADEGSEEPRVHRISPGLAVDPDGRVAYVVPASGPVAEVDLETLEVAYHELDKPSLLGRVLRWLTPAAQAKGLSDGRWRWAQWLGNGLIAVSGTDHSFVRGATGEEQDTSTPAGLRLIDTRSWKTRMLDPKATDFVGGRSLLVARDGLQVSAPPFRAFNFDGSERWTLPTAGRYLSPAGPLGYVYLGETRAEVVDLATGKVIATVSRTGPWPQLLAAQSSG